MKVLFLDIDGVLNSADWFANMPKGDGWGMATCDPKAVKRLLRVLEVTGATLVLSSTWRLVPELVEKLKTEYKLPIADVTPVLNDRRCDEIVRWLADNVNDQQVSGLKFAIIDDDGDAGDHPLLKPHFVRTHWKHGMYGKHEKKLIELLSASAAHYCRGCGEEDYVCKQFPCGAECDCPS